MRQIFLPHTWFPPAGQKKAFIYVNNRLEGNALATIAAMIS